MPESTKQGLYEFTEREAIAKGPPGFGPVCCVYFSFQLSTFIRLLSVGTSGSLIIVPALGTLFLLLGCLVQS